jgi:transposase
LLLEDFMSYSLDFRECVVFNVSGGMSWAEASRIFNISQETIRHWLGKLKDGQDLSDKPRRTYKHRKIDPQKLSRFIKSKPDATLKELAHEFDCCFQAIDYRCKSLKLTRKKNHAVSGAERGKKKEIPVRD